MSNIMRWLPAGLCLASLLLCTRNAVADDLLKDTKDRMAIEAQRVEREFAANRLAAYKLVRSDSPQLLDSTQKLQDLLDMLRADTSLDSKRRTLLIVTIKADLDRVRDIATERRRATVRATAPAVTRTIRDDIVRRDETRDSSSRRMSDEVRSIYDSRRQSLNDIRSDRLAKAERFNGVMRGVDKSSTPVARDYQLPRNWAELSKRRSTGQKMTAKERAVVKVLNSTLTVDYNKNTLEEVIEHLRKVTKVDIVVDKRALEEAGSSYESTVTLKRKSTTRTILKRILGELNLAYVVKEGAILITSRERASQMTTVRKYYLGDLAAAVNTNLPPLLSQAIAIQNINNLINLITTTVDPQSWKINNPDAPGTIALDPITMTLIIRQTAEIHFQIGSR